MTDREIRVLRREALEHGDLRMAVICEVALGESLEGADPGTEAWLLAKEGIDRAQALAECERVVQTAKDAEQ